MEEQQKSPDSSDLQEEAKVFLRLGQLLQKKRTPSEKLKVEEIMATAQSEKEKLAQLESLEPAHPSPYSRKPEFQKETSETVSPSPTSSAIADPTRPKPSLQKTLLRQGRIVKEMTVTSFWKFLFLERNRILDFGRRTETLTKGKWVWSLSVKPETFAYLRDHLQKDWANGLRKILKVLLDRSWKYLTKTEYNLLALMDRLCAQIEDVQFGSLNSRDPRVIGSLKSVEKYFLVFYSRSDYVDLTLFALEKALTKDPHQEAVRSIGQTLIKKVLGSSGSRPSLYHVLEGWSMIRYRRFLQLPELMVSDQGPFVCHDEFDCTPQVQEFIDKSVTENVIKLHNLKERLDETRRLRSHIKYTPDGNVDYLDWERIYDQTVHSKGGRWAQDQDNYFLFGATLAEGFILSFDAILTGACLFADEKKRKLFAPELFSLDLEKMQLLIPRLRKTGFSFPGFSSNRFRTLRTTGGVATSTETEGVSFLQELGRRFVHLGQSLILILQNRLPWEDGTEYPPLTPLILGGRGAALPGEGYLVAENFQLGGRTALEIVQWIISLCLSAGILFYEESVLGLAKAETSLRDEVRSRLEYLERVADKLTWEAQKTLFL